MRQKIIECSTLFSLMFFMVSLSQGNQVIKLPSTQNLSWSTDNLPINSSSQYPLQIYFLRKACKSLHLSFDRRNNLKNISKDKLILKNYFRKDHINNTNRSSNLPYPFSICYFGHVSCEKSSYVKIMHLEKEMDHVGENDSATIENFLGVIRPNCDEFFSKAIRLRRKRNISVLTKFWREAKSPFSSILKKASTKISQSKLNATSSTLQASNSIPSVFFYPTSKHRGTRPLPPPSISLNSQETNSNSLYFPETNSNSPIIPHLHSSHFLEVDSPRKSGNENSLIFSENGGGRIERGTFGSKAEPKSSSEEVDKQELPVHKRTSVQYSSLVGPSFVNSSFHAKAHALAGQTARLNCAIRNLHNYTVSWIRALDINLLTSGKVTYSSDKRFVSANPSNGTRWVLRIHHVKLSDAGKYLCQISTSPPMTATVTLAVTEAMGNVEPAREVFLKVGSPVSLVCIIRGCPYPALPTWYKEGRLQKNLIIEESTLTFRPVASSTITPSLSTSALSPTPSPTLHSPSSTTFYISPKDQAENPNPASSHPSEGSSIPKKALEEGEKPLMEEVLVAKVTLQRPKATPDLSGTYSCTNTCTDPLNLTLHVLSGDEETAAMQHHNRSMNHRPLSLVVYILEVHFCYLFFLLYNDVHIRKVVTGI